ncbi:MAG: VCBS repeat-containing protein, partial [Isosphaeraceae bacterium]|nr:VCBS repeat-containing protein [Isosphaeraceae bacterium]
MRRRRRFQLEALESRLCLAGPQPYPGTPFALPAGPWTSTPFVGSPIFADLNSDGKDELITPVAGGKLMAFSYGPNGGIVPYQTYDTGVTGFNIKTTPVVVTMPNGRKAVFAALMGDEANPNSLTDGRVFGWDAQTGALLPGWPQDTGFAAPNQNHSGVIAPLASGDLDGDGTPEIVVASLSNFVTAYHLDGSVMWRVYTNDTNQSGPVIGDIDKDGKNEVVFGSDTSPGEFFQAGGFVNIYNWDGTPRYQIHTDEVIWSSPVLVD